MKNVAAPVARGTVAAQEKGDEREQAEANRIVRPVASKRIEVGAAVAFVQLRTSQHDEGRTVRGLGCEQLGGRKRP
jgi:hypothetical protein